MSPGLPDRSYQLDPATRARVAPHFDANALERLVQHLTPEARPSFIEQFLIAPPAEATADGHVPDVSILTRISDPVMQGLLEEVWQPYWATMPDAALDNAGGPPGRELARRRRGEKGSG